MRMWIIPTNAKETNYRADECDTASESEEEFLGFGPEDIDSCCSEDEFQGFALADIDRGRSSGQISRAVNVDRSKHPTVYVNHSAAAL